MFFRRIALIASVFFASLSHAAYYSGTLKPHGHNSNVDGGVIANLFITGPSPWVDVKTFGAKGDGSHDDTSAINNAIVAANGGTVRLGNGDYKITSPINITKYGTQLVGYARNSTLGSSGTRIINAGTGTNAINVGTGVNNATIRDLSIIGNAGSSDGIHFSSGSIGHIRLENLYIEVKNDGISTSYDGVMLYMESVRIYGGNIPFNLKSTSTVINTIVGVNLYAQNATANSGFLVHNVANFECTGCSADNNFYGFELLDTKATLISCSAENNSSKGFYGHGVGTYIFISPYTYSQLMPFEINAANASATWINPRTDATPSGASLNIVSSNGDCSLIGRALLDGGLQGSSSDHFNIYTDANQLNTSKKIVISKAGATVQVKEGTNACMGTKVLASGSGTVSTSCVSANSRIFLTTQSSTNQGTLYISARNPGTNFTIQSNNGADASTVAWWIVEPAP